MTFTSVTEFDILNLLNLILSRIIGINQGCNRIVQYSVRPNTIWQIQYTLASPNSSVPIIEKIVRISEITLIQWGINYNKFALLEYQRYYLAMIAYLMRFLNLIDIQARFALACAARLANTSRPPEAPFGRLESHWLIIREIHL